MNKFAQLVGASALTLLLPTASSLEQDNGGTLVLDGGPAKGWDQNSWYVQVDGVMGGLSTGELEFVGEGTAASTLRFSGDISLDGGGFSSVRKSFPTDLDLTSYAGIVVTLQAQPIDGSALGWPSMAPLGMHLQLDDSSSRYGFSSAYAVPFSAGSDGEGEESASIFLPMSSFDRGTWIGFQCTDCALDAARVRGMSLYVLFQEGTFEVNVESIAAVKDAKSFAMPSIAFDSYSDVVTYLRATISSGGSLYDKSYSELCIAMYWSALSSVVAAMLPEGDDTAMSADALRGLACAGLSQSLSEGTKVGQAWALRYTIDAMISDMEGTERTSAHDWLPPDVDSAEKLDDQCVGRTSMTSDIFHSSTNITSNNSTQSSIPFLDESGESMGKVEEGSMVSAQKEEMGRGPGEGVTEGRSASGGNTPAVFSWLLLSCALCPLIGFVIC